MSVFRINLPGTAPPASISNWLLEGAIALAIGAYLTYQCHEPLTRILNRTLGIQAEGSVAAVVLTVVVFPLVWAFVAMLVLLLAGRLPRAARLAVDMLTLTVLITALIIPAVQTIVTARQAPRLNAQNSPPPQPVQTGPLNFAPAPLKLERITLGAEVLNTGTQPLEVGISFVRLNERGRLYCAGNPLARVKNDRIRLAAGESAIFRSGNCQDGHVALTVWNNEGKRVYQTTVIAPSAGAEH